MGQSLLAPLPTLVAEAWRCRGARLEGQRRRGLATLAGWDDAVQRTGSCEGENTWAIVDLQSTDGTDVNGKRIQAPQVFKEGDRTYR